MKRLPVLAVAFVSAILAGCASPNVSELNQMGLKEFQAGRYSHAKAYFQQAWEQDRERPATLYNLGRCAQVMAEERFEQGSLTASLRYLDDAVAWFDSAIASFPGYTAAQEAKVQALELKGKYRQALSVAEWADQHVGPAAKQKIVLAGHYERTGDMDQALLCYRQAVAMETRSSFAHAKLGRFYARQGKKDQAVAELQRAYELDPEQEGLLRELAELGEVPSTPSDK